MTYSPSGKLSIGPRSASSSLDVRERRQDGEAEHGQRDDRADRGAETERRRAEEVRARIGRERLARLGGVGRSLLGVCLLGGRPCLRLDLRHVFSHVARDPARPEEPEDDREDRADHGDDPADDETEQQARHPDGEADRPQTRAGDVRSVVSGIAQGGPGRDSTTRRSGVNDVPSVATGGFARAEVGVRTTRRSRIRPSGARRDRGSRPT